MRMNLLTMFMISILILFGCGTGQNNQEGTGNQNNRTNIEPTSYDDNNPNRINNNNNNQLRGNGTQNLTNRQNDRSRHNVIDDQQNGRQNDRFDISQRAADRITDEVDEIRYAYVLTTNNNAYVAAVTDHDRHDNHNQGEELNDNIKNQIANIVQSVDPDIDNVYVSTNPDFVDLVNNYADDVNNDRPIRGMFDQLAEMIERVFPENER